MMRLLNPNANTAQALADAEHKFDGDTGATSVRKHGEVLSIKGGVTNAADLTTGNIGVVSDGAGTLNIRLAKVLSGLTSATFKDASGNTQTLTGASSIISDGAGNTTTMTKGGLSTTDGTNTTTVAPTGVTATDGTNTVKLNGSASMRVIHKLRMLPKLLQMMPRLTRNKWMML